MSHHHKEMNHTKIDFVVLWVYAAKAVREAFERKFPSPSIFERE